VSGVQGDSTATADRPIAGAWATKPFWSTGAGYADLFRLETKWDANINRKYKAYIYLFVCILFATKVLHLELDLSSVSWFS
jgi:hypothetical protein